MRVPESPATLRNARLAPSAEPVDLLVRDGLISAIRPAGSERPEGEDVDLAGRAVLPGLWDHHVHFDQWAQVSRRLDLSTADSAGAVAELVREHLATARRTGAEFDVPIVGYGFRDAVWPDAPSRAELDGATAELPAVMVSGDLHSAWLNSAALRRFGHADHPSGLLQEGPAMQVLAELSQVPDEIGDGWAREAAKAAAARGVVGIVDLESPWSLDSWVRRIGSGNRYLRIRSGVWPARLEDALGRGLKTGDTVAETGGLLTMGPLKVITDGSLNTRTAYCHDPYPGLLGTPQACGLLLVRPEELVPLMRRARAAGLECAIHAIGDHANSLALQAFFDSGASGSIEHAQLLDTGDVARFAELGIVASVQPEHAMDDRDVADHHWAGRTGRAFVLRSLLDAGARIALGSDAPVAPLDPWTGIAAAVHRSRDGRSPWHPEQAITVEEALDATVGRPAVLRVGDAADLVVCGIDPRTATPIELRAMPVDATMLAGRWTHTAGL